MLEDSLRRPQSSVLTSLLSFALLWPPDNAKTPHPRANKRRVEQLVGERGHDTQRQHSQRRCQPPKASASLRLPSRPCSPLRSIGAWRPELEAGGWRGREMLAQATLCKLPHPLSSYSAAAMIRPIFFRQCRRKAARILTPNMVVHM